MSKQLQQTINTAQQLSIAEQFELLKTMFEDLLAQSRAKFKLIDLIIQLLPEAFYQQLSTVQ